MNMADNHQYMFVLLCDIIGPCQHGSVRAVNRYGTISRKGNVELCVYGKWRAICANSWDNRDASVVCRETGHSPFGKSVSSV